MASINFSNALGIHPSALQLRAARAEVLANNLANDAAHGFKDLDINCQAVLKGEMHSSRSVGLERTHSGHIDGRGNVVEELLFRNPSQPSIDGNRVDSQMEQALIGRNAMNYN